MAQFGWVRAGKVRVRPLVPLPVHMVGLRKPANALRATVKRQKQLRPLKTKLVNARRVRVVPVLPLPVLLLRVRRVGQVVHGGL